VKVGDMVTLRADFARAGNTVVSQCLDNRVACWIAIRAIEKLKQHKCEIHCVFTVQEEVGLRGARTAAYRIKPDIGIALDTTLCVDTPGVPDDMAVTRQGEGVGITCMDSTSIGDYDLIAQFESIAKKKKIAHQRSILPRGGTDAGTMQSAGEGVRTITLSCGTRYIHTVTEMIHVDDMHATRDLLAAYLSEA
jgi:endoglucanase